MSCWVVECFFSYVMRKRLFACVHFRVILSKFPLHCFCLVVVYCMYFSCIESLRAIIRLSQGFLHDWTWRLIHILNSWAEFLPLHNQLKPQELKIQSYMIQIFKFYIFTLYFWVWKDSTSPEVHRIHLICRRALNKENCRLSMQSFFS